jgi:hypothetical protein
MGKPTGNNSTDAITFDGRWCDQSANTCSAVSAISHTETFSSYTAGHEILIKATEAAPDTDATLAMRISYTDVDVGMSGNHQIVCNVPYFVQ